MLGPCRKRHLIRRNVVAILNGVQALAQFPFGIFAFALYCCRRGAPFASARIAVLIADFP